MSSIRTLSGFARQDSLNSGLVDSYDYGAGAACIGNADTATRPLDWGLLMPNSVLDRIKALLATHHIEHQVLHHAPVYTSQEAAAVRGTSLASGAKALICKVDEGFAMLVVPADRKLASSNVRKQLQARSLRFASQEEVLAQTGLTPGSIPPFGSLFGLKTYCDQRLPEAGTINFNAGDHAVSISMACADYLAVEQPTLGAFAE
jgi:Ala-tRNA(Pro) deacylase